MLQISNLFKGLSDVSFWVILNGFCGLVTYGDADPTHGSSGAFSPSGSAKWHRLVFRWKNLERVDMWHQNLLTSTCKKIKWFWFPWLCRVHCPPVIMPAIVRDEVVEELKASQRFLPNQITLIVWAFNSMPPSIHVFLAQAFYDDFINSVPGYVENRRAEIKVAAGMKATDRRVSRLQRCWKNLKVNYHPLIYSCQLDIEIFILILPWGTEVFLYSPSSQEFSDCEDTWCETSSSANWRRRGFPSTIFKDVPYYNSSMFHGLDSPDSPKSVWICMSLPANRCGTMWISRWLQAFWRRLASIGHTRWKWRPHFHNHRDAQKIFR